MNNMIVIKPPIFMPLQKHLHVFSRSPIQIVSHCNDFFFSVKYATTISDQPMASTTATPPPANRKTRVCFSIAAYSKHLIAHLHHHSNVPIAHGLTQTELTTIESSFNFTFPPDLRSILCEGLPVGHGFPNWRSSSPQQLDIIINLPILGLCKEVSRKKFWYRGWGDRPEDDDEAVELAKGSLKRSPVLVPVYRNFYIPATPCVYGNPVFYVHGADVRLCSYDIIGLFHEIEFREGVVGGMMLGHMLSVPPWAATEAGRVEFWTDVAEIRRVRSELGRCLEDVRVILRGGGWKDLDLDEMLMVEMNDDTDEKSSVSLSASLSSSVSWSSDTDEEIGAVKAVVRVLSRRLLRGGWSMGDVVESLGCLSECTVEIENGGGGGDCLFDFEHNSYSCRDDGQSRV